MLCCRREHEAGTAQVARMVRWAARLAESTAGGTSMREEIGSPLRQPGAALILVGDVLVIVGWFSPWLHLYTSFGDTPGDLLVGPWTLLRGSAEVSVAGGSPSAFAWVFVWVCFPVAALLASSLASLRMRTPGEKTALVVLALLLAGWCLVFACAALVLAPQSIGLSWPYPAIRGVEYGACVGPFGFVCVALGLVAYLLDTRRQR
jgi:hypothetical protein